MWRGSLPGVYVMNENNQRELRLVRTGDDVGSDGVAILSGLRAGERVLSSEGAHRPSQAVHGNNPF